MSRRHTDREEASHAVLDGLQSHSVADRRRGDIGIIRYQSHPTDRRNKPLVINERNERSEIPRAIARATEVDLRGELIRRPNPRD